MDKVDEKGQEALTNAYRLHDEGPQGQGHQKVSLFAFDLNIGHCQAVAGPVEGAHDEPVESSGGC